MSGERFLLDTNAIVALQSTLLKLIVKTRKEHRLKLPDAIIAATSLWCNATLATADAEFKRVGKLRLAGWK